MTLHWISLVVEHVWKPESKREQSQTALQGFCTAL